MSSNVLIVDDHRPNLIVLEAVLEPLHVNFIAVHSAEEALAVVAQVDLAAILTDLRMAGMSGVELAGHVRAGVRNGHVPILILSAVDRDDPVLKQALQLERVHFMQKPSAPADLRALVRKLLGP